MAALTGKIIGLSIAMFILSAIGVSAIVALANANTTGLSTEELVIYGVLVLVAILVFLILLLKEAGIKVA